MENYYDMLRVRRDATRDEIKLAYRHHMKHNHPDRIREMEDPEERAIAEAIAKDASRAYQELVDDDRRAKYDRKLADFERSQAPAPEAPSRASSTRRTVNLSGDRPSSPAQRSRFDITPENWSWFSPTKTSGDVAGTRKPSSGKGRTIALRIAGIAFWLGWAVVSMFWWHGPLLAVESSQDPTTWWGAGLIAHAVITVLTLTRWLWKKVPLIVVGAFLALCTAAVVTSAHEVAGTVGFWLAAAAPLGATAGSVLSTSFGLIPGIALRNRKAPDLVDSEQFITVGSHSLGRRHPDISALIGALHLAFRGREGVRVIVLPDRVSSPQIKAQAVVTVGADVHLIAIPPLGDSGFEISGRSISASGMTLRNVVLDEAEDVRRSAGKKVGKIYPYVVPTRIDSIKAQELSKVTYACLDDAIRLIGERSSKGLDKPNRSARRTVFEAMPRLLSEADRAAAR